MCACHSSDICLYYTSHVRCTKSGWCGPYGVIYIDGNSYSKYPEDYWPCADGLLLVGAIGAQLRDPMNLALTLCRLTVWMDAVAESERNPFSKHQIQLECGE